MSITCTFEFSFFLTDIWSGNDTSDTPFILHRDFSGDFTAAVQIFQIKRFFISADLQYRICRSINDHGSCIDFFFSKFINNRCSAGALVTDYFFAASFFQFCNQFRWESCICEGNERLFCFDTHHLPMTGHRILSIAHFSKTTISSQRFFNRLHISCRMQIHQT